MYTTPLCFCHPQRWTWKNPIKGTVLLGEKSAGNFFLPANTFL